MHGRRLDLWTAAERALREAGCADVHRFDLCTRCNPDLFFSERRTGRPRGTHGVLGLVTAEDVRERYERIRGEVGPDVTVVAATKYVSLEDMAVLVDAGIDVVGENRAQDLEAKHERYGDAFRWHFIGHLQSRKATTVNGICELVHSLDRDRRPAARPSPRSSR